MGERGGTEKKDFPSSPLVAVMAEIRSRLLLRRRVLAMLIQHAAEVHEVSRLSFRLSTVARPVGVNPGSG